MSICPAPDAGRVPARVLGRVLGPAFALVLAFALWPQGLAAKTRAVLIGVGDYVNFDADLQGPPNDVRLMAQMLLRRGVAPQDIVALTDDTARLPHPLRARPPDRAAIMDALAQSVGQSGAGDTLVIYFSGHGSQAPDQNGDEAGGMDEIFLPRDAGRWNGAAGAVDNAILDDDLSAVVAEATAKDVQVVGIVDACHSATGFRAVGEGRARARYVDPALLGIPEAEAGAGTPPAPVSGDFVFLYAAQSDQRAFEYPVEGAWYGDFTRNLVNVLNDVPALSYDQLVQAVTVRLQTRSGQAAQTPVIEGPLATGGVFGGDSPGLRRIEVSGAVLQAGALQGVTNGTELALFSGPLARETVGRARVTGLRAIEADISYLPPVPAVRVTHAEIVRRGVDVGFAVALAPGAAAALDSRVAGGRAGLAAALDVPLVARAEHTVVWTGTGFALVGRDGILDAAGPGSSPRLATGDAPDLVATLAAAITRHARRVRLEQALSQLAGAGATGFSLLKSGPDVRFTRTPGAARGSGCRADGASQPLSSPAAARHCDTLDVRVSNGSTRAQDVTLLYIDAEAGISVLWPRATLSNRVPAGKSRTMRIGLRNTGQGVAAETLLVLSVPAGPGAARTVLDGLAGGTSRGAQTPLAVYLAGLADPDTGTRSLTLTPPGGDLNMARLDLTIAPAPVDD